MTNDTLHIQFQEEYCAKLPALALLINLGWPFLSSQYASAARSCKADKEFLRYVFTVVGKSYLLFGKANQSIHDLNCQTVLIVANHFPEVRKMVPIRFSAERSVANFVSPISTLLAPSKCGPSCKLSANTVPNNFSSKSRFALENVHV